VRATVKLKKDALEAWLSLGLPKSTDRYQVAKRAVATDAKTPGGRVPKIDEIQSKMLKVLDVVELSWLPYLFNVA